MKKSFYFFGLATIVAAAFTFTGCSSDDPENEVKKPEEEKAISFTTTITNNARTRATTENLQTTSIANGVEVGIFATPIGGSVTKGSNEYAYTSNGNGGLTIDDANKMTCEAGVTAISFNAYAPYNSNWTSAQQTFTVQSDQRTDANYLASDLLYGTGTLEGANITNGAQAALTFRHKLSRIKIVLEAAAGSSVDLNNATVTIKNTLPSIAFTPGTGDLGSTSGSETEITAGTGVTTYAIVVPQTVTSGTELISIDINGDGSKVLTAKLGADQIFASGETYTFTISDIGDFGTPASTRTLGTPTTSINPDWTNGSSQSLTKDHLWATFNIPDGNALYDANTSTYSWWAGNTCLMQIFSGNSGDFNGYTKLHFTVSNVNYTAGSVRFVFTYGGSENTIYYGYENGNTYSQLTAGYYTIDISSYASTLTKIRFGGGGTTTGASSQSPFTIGIKATDVYLSKE